jgi:catechol 2,3-dioxygenase-like lactoylglutathione lyase family enzyme
MDNVGIVVEDIDTAIEFFTELGLTLEGRMPIEGEWAGRVTGVRGQRVEIAMLRTPDGHSRLELSRFDAPAVASDHRIAPVNSLGYLRVMFTVEDLDDTQFFLLTLIGALLLHGLCWESEDGIHPPGKRQAGHEQILFPDRLPIPFQIVSPD